MQAEAMRFPKTRQGVRDLDQMPSSYVPASGGPVPPALAKNIGETERVLSLLAGGGLIGACLANPSPVALLGGLLGTALAYRGYTGHCELNRLLGRNTADPLRAPDEMAYQYR